MHLQGRSNELWHAFAQAAAMRRSVDRVISRLILDALSRETALIVPPIWRGPRLMIHRSGSEGSESGAVCAETDPARSGYEPVLMNETEDGAAVSLHGLRITPWCQDASTDQSLLAQRRSLRSSGRRNRPERCSTYGAIARFRRSGPNCESPTQITRMTFSAPTASSFGHHRGRVCDGRASRRGRGAPATPKLRHRHPWFHDPPLHRASPADRWNNMDVSPETASSSKAAMARPAERRRLAIFAVGRKTLIGAPLEMHCSPFPQDGLHGQLHRRPQTGPSSGVSFPRIPIIGSPIREAPQWRTHRSSGRARADPRTKEVDIIADGIISVLGGITDGIISVLGGLGGRNERHLARLRLVAGI
jgi:hypothetical protein